MTISAQSEEIWKDVPGLKVKASSHGRIKSFYRFSEGKILRLQKGARGKYQRVQLQHREKIHSVHQLVTMAFHENPNGYKIVNHKDRNGLNNCPDNLEWCDQKHNVNHANGHIEKWNLRRFDKAQKQSMKDAFTKGFSKNSIGKYFRTTDTTIRRIVTA